MRHAVSVEALFPDLPPIHADQRWRATCGPCEWEAEERHFEARSVMDGDLHLRGIDTRDQWIRSLSRAA